jgi:hypothetical protein
VNNLAGPDNLAVLDDGRVLIGEDTGKHENNMVWLWEPTVEPETGDGEGGNGGEGSGTVNGSETITVNHVVLVDTPLHKEWEWNYSYQVEANDLQMEVNYTAIINIYRLEDSWEGLDWWWDIDWEGGYDEDNDGYHNQFNFTLSLQSGCYHINAVLYESGALHSDEDSAAVLASADLDFDVGGICMDGVFSSVFDSDGDGIIDKLDYCPDTSQGETVNAKGCSESDLSGTGEDGDDDDATSIPGFGLLSSITAALGAAIVATRRE